MKLLKKIPKKVWNTIWNIIVSFVMVLALIISLMPIIAWYAGLFGLVFLIFQWMKNQLNSEVKDKAFSFNEIQQIKHGKKALYIVLFGLLLHGSCRIHSQILVNDLYHDAIHEKNIILTNVENK